MDETLLKVGSDLIWLWIAIEPDRKQANSRTINIQGKKHVCDVDERCLSGLVKVHGKHPVSTDGGIWYPVACQFLKLRHHTHSSLEKNLIERTIQYIKDRTESFDVYFPCRSKTRQLKHVRKWLNLFVKYYNKKVVHA